MNSDIILSIIILVIFCIAAAVMFTRKMPALLVLPIMAILIAASGMFFYPIDLKTDILEGVIAEGSIRLHRAMIVAFFGGVLSFIMQKSGVAESLIKNAAELIGDNPLMVAIFTMTLVSLLFTTIGGLGAIIMVAMVFLPMLATVGVPPVVAGGIMLIGISLGGLLNPGNWILYEESMGVGVSEVKGIALLGSGLVYIMGVVFVCVELFRAGAVRSQSQIFLTMGGAVLVAMIAAVALVRTGGPASQGMLQTPIYNPDFQEFVEFSPQAQSIVREAGAAKFLLPGELPAEELELVAVNPENRHSGQETFELFFPNRWDDISAIQFNAQSSAPLALQVNFLDEAGEIIASTERTPTGLLPGRRDVPAFGSQAIRVTLEEFPNLSPSQITGLRIAAIQDEASTQTLPITLRMTTPRIQRVETTPIFMTVLQILFGLFFLYIFSLIFLDLRKKIRRWRQQIVTIQWYSYLIPILPLILILIYGIDILSAFFIGFIYAILTTLRPGWISLTIQSMIQGASQVMPAVLLMVGIGILLNAVLGPGGWSEANDGMVWPIRTALEPLFTAVLPKDALGYILFFTVFSPLALYRGPLNLWGLGFGVAGLLLTVLPSPAVVAMMLIVGQVQGICDPTNTHNVWLANELRVDVQTLMWRTLPYVCAMVAVGLTISVYGLGVLDQ